MVEVDDDMLKMMGCDVQKVGGEVVNHVISKYKTLNIRIYI